MAQVPCHYIFLSGEQGEPSSHTQINISQDQSTIYSQWNLRDLRPQSEPDEFIANLYFYSGNAGFLSLCFEASHMLEKGAFC